MQERFPPQLRQRRAAIAAGRGRNCVQKPRSGKSALAERAATQAVGAVFRSARESQRLSQHQVAELSEGRLSRAAISDIERGRSLPGLETLVRLSRILHVDTTEVLERIELDPTTPVDVTDLSFDDLLQRARERFWGADYRGALGLYDAAAERLILDPPPDAGEQRRQQARIEINRAVALRRCSALKAAEAAAKRAIRLAGGAPELQARAYIVLASLYSHEGLDSLAEVAVDKAVTLAESCGPEVQGQAWTQKADILFREGRFEDARQAFLRARKGSLEAKDHRNLIKVEGCIGTCLAGLRRYADARRRLVKAIDLGRKYHDLAGEAFWLLELGRLCLATGEFDEADRMAIAALNIARPSEQHLTVFRAEWLRHLVARAKAPDKPDERRLNHLTKLYQRVRGHKAFDEITEFETRVLLPANGREETP